MYLNTQLCCKIHVQNSNKRKCTALLINKSPNLPRRNNISNSCLEAVMKIRKQFAPCPFQGELRISVLPTHLSYDAPWPVRKVPLRCTPHFVAYNRESKVMALIQDNVIEWPGAITQCYNVPLFHCSFVPLFHSSVVPLYQSTACLFFFSIV